MAEFWTSISRGSNINAGTYEEPFKSFARLIEALTDSNEKSAGYVEQGYYFEGSIPMEGMSDSNIIGVGEVIVDATGHDDVFGNCEYESETIAIMNIEFKNFAHYLIRSVKSAFVIFENCRIVYDGTFYGSLTENEYNRLSTNSAVHYRHCIFYGFSYIRFDYAYLSKCVFEAQTDLAFPSGWTDLATSDTAYLANGTSINSSTNPPPFTDITDPAHPNLNYDPGHVNFGLYTQCGATNEIIGTASLGGAAVWALKSSINSNTINTSMSIADSEFPSRGAWENCNNYYDKNWATISITTGLNDTFQFVESAGPITATIAQGDYLDATSFTVAVQAAIDNSLAVDVHTILFGTNIRLDWSTNGASLTLNCNSYSSNDAWAELGFDTIADKSGTSRYYSDTPLCGGPVAGAFDLELNAGAVDISPDGTAVIDLSIVPDATNADMVSPVTAFYMPKKIGSVGVARTILGAGEVDSTQGTSERTIMVRANNAPFGMHDADGTTALDWTHVAAGFVDISATADAYKFWQERLRLRNNATP